MTSISRKDAFFGMHTDVHAHEDDPNLGADLDESMIEHVLDVLEPDYVQCDCKGHRGYTTYPTQVGWTPKGLTKDILRMWREVTRRRGVALIVHYSGLWDRAAVVHHPDWAVVQADGTPHDFALSLFSPYLEELMIPQLEETITGYDPDGAWIDADCWGVTLDYGEKAVAAFCDATGATKAPRSADDPYWHDFLELHRKQFRNYVRRYADALHALKPDFHIASNWLYAPGSPEPATLPVDFLSGDYMPEEAAGNGRLASRYLPWTGKPWDLMAWTHTKGDRQRNRTFKPAAQLQQEAASVLTQGGGWQLIIMGTRTSHLDDASLDIAAEAARFCRERQALCHGGRSVAQVALVLPSESLYEKMEVPFRFHDAVRAPLQGLLDALLELHYSVDILAEHQLKGRTSDFPVVVVPDCHRLPDAFKAELIEFVREGGALLLGGPRVAALFSDDLGISGKDDLVDMDKQYDDLAARVEYPDHMFLHPDFPELHVEADGALSDCGGPYWKVEPDTAEVISRWYPSKDTRGLGACASSVVEHGRGLIGAIYVSLGRNFFDSHLPGLRVALGRIMARLFPRPLVSVEGPPCIDVSLKAKDGKLLVHLVNTNGMAIAPYHAARDHIPPIRNVKVTVQLDHQPTSFRWAYGGRTTQSDYEHPRLQVILDELAIHDALIVEPVP